MIPLHPNDDFQPPPLTLLEKALRMQKEIMNQNQREKEQEEQVQLNIIENQKNRLEREKNRFDQIKIYEEQKKLLRLKKQQAYEEERKSGVIIFKMHLLTEEKLEDINKKRINRSKCKQIDSSTKENEEVDAQICIDSDTESDTDEEDKEFKQSIQLAKSNLEQQGQKEDVPLEDIGFGVVHHTMALVFVLGVITVNDTSWLRPQREPNGELTRVFSIKRDMRMIKRQLREKKEQIENIEREMETARQYKRNLLKKEKK
ncbi:MAG: hypothetical protein EZS28_034666, partial [Streblomastix strix]